MGHLLFFDGESKKMLRSSLFLPLCSTDNVSALKPDENMGSFRLRVDPLCDDGNGFEFVFDAEARCNEMMQSMVRNIGRSPQSAKGMRCDTMH